MKLQCQLTVDIYRLTRYQWYALQESLIDIGFTVLRFVKVDIIQSEWVVLQSAEHLADLTVDLALLLEVDYGNLIVSRLEFKHG